MPWFETFRSDVGFALRLLRKSPGFVVTTILTLALGIGANTAAFGLLHALVLRPLPVSEPDRVVVMFGGFRNSWPYGRFSYQNYLDIRERTTMLQSVAAYAWATPLDLRTSASAPAERVWAQPVSGNFFDTLGIQAAYGRTFAADEDRTRLTHPVVVLSHRLWRARLNGDPSIVGHTLRLNGLPYTVIGIAPERMAQIDPPFAPDVWVPIAMTAHVMPGQENKLDSRLQKWLRGVARLRSGVTIAQAQAELTGIADGLVAAHPVQNRNMILTLVPEPEARAQTLGTSARLSWVLLALVALVLLMACANLANLLLVRAFARAKEMSVRASLGAGRGRLVRQLLTEHGLLALVGGAAGVALAVFLSTRLWTLVLPPGPRTTWIDTSEQMPVLAFAIACTVLTAILFGLVPALRASRVSLTSALKGADAVGASGRRGWGVASRGTLHEALVVAQLALCVVVLAAAALFLRSLSAATHMELAFTPENRVVASIELGLQGYDTARARAFHDALLTRVRALRGVEAATYTAILPLSGGYVSDPKFWRAEEHASNDDPRPFVITDLVGADYFRTMGTTILRGRDLTEADRLEHAAPVAVINAEVARTFWPGQDPIGRFFRIGRAESPLIEVVGLVADGQYETLGERPQRRVFLPFVEETGGTLIVHTKASPAAMLMAIREIVSSLDPQVPVARAETLSDHVARSVAQPRVFAMLASTFGFVALLLAVIGVYGTLSFLVRGRMREIAVRVALGALPRQVLLMVMRRGSILAACGLAAGGIVAALVCRWLATMLYGATTLDVRTGTIVGSVLALAVLLASALPARRALRINLVRALRQE
jgi:predicted permease